jgi:hypothetical protein
VDHNGCKKGAFAKTVVTIAFRKRRWVSWVNDRLSACFFELVSHIIGYIPHIACGQVLKFSFEEMRG